MKKFTSLYLTFIGLFILTVSFAFKSTNTLDGVFFDDLSHNCIGTTATNINTSGTESINELLVEKQEVRIPLIQFPYDAPDEEATEIKYAIFNSTHDLVYENTLTNNAFDITNATIYIEVESDSLCIDTFQCSSNSVLYQVLGGNEFVVYNSVNSNFTSIHVNNFNINAIGYNIEDNLIYGIRANTNTNHLVVVGADGMFDDLGEIDGLPDLEPLSYNIGDFDQDGNLYVTRNGSSTIYKINIDLFLNNANYTATAIQLTDMMGFPTTIPVYDFAFIPSGSFGGFYGISSNGNLYSFVDNNDGTGTVTNLGALDPAISCTAYGAAFADANDNLYFFCNGTGDLYQVDKNAIPPTSIFLQSTSASNLSANDGAACPLSNGLDTCCLDEMTFITAVENAVTIQVNQDFCEATVHINDLSDCDLITQIDWGDGNSSFGPFGNGDMPEHLYGSVSGVFDITIYAAGLSQNGDTCFTHTFMEMIDLNCPSVCECNGWEELSLTHMSEFPTETALICNNDIPVQLECPFKKKAFFVHGNFNCTDSCGMDLVWEMVPDGSTTPISSGTVPGYAYSGTTYHFDINAIPYPPAGLYHLNLSAACGMENCTCSILLEMPDCDPGCICENPILPTDSNPIIGTIHTSGCNNTLFPKVTLHDECDIVEWTYREPGSIEFATLGTTQGNDYMSADFQSLGGVGTYTVCMELTRTLPSGVTCEAEKRCQKVKISCGLPTLNCAGTLVENPNFMDGAVPGVLGDGGLSTGWEPSLDGAPGVAETLNPEEYVMVLTGNKTEARGLQTTVELNGASRYRLEIKLDLLPQQAHGGAIFVRLSNEEQTSLNCGGDCVELLTQWAILTSDTLIDWIPAPIVLDTIPYAIPIVIDTIPIWVTYIELEEGFNTGTKYLTVHVGNNSENPDFKSVGILSGICLEAYDYTGVQELTQVYEELKLYPNPTSGSITVDFSEAVTKDLDYRVIDLLGRTVKNGSFSKGLQRYGLEMADLSSSVYFIEIGNAEQGYFRERIVKHNP